MTKTRNFIIAMLASVFMITGALAMTIPAQAQFAPGNPSAALDKSVGETGLVTGDADTQLFQIIGDIINIVLGLLGIIFFIYVVWAGFIWMTAGGEAGKIEKAQKMLVQGTIGLVIMLAAYAISNFAVSNLLDATKNT
jgi:hypothetical protein